MPAVSPRLIKLASDARLVAYVREGRAGAFEAVYDRHHRAILSFCRHLLGDQHEAEDAVQQTFMSAYTSLLRSERQIHLRPWLYAIARNRCYSVLRSQRERPTGEIDEAITEGLPSEVQRRQDLRDLVSDLRRLPDEQRAAIVLAELDSLSHADIAEVLGVPREKVKALVFQARESLLTSRTARDTPCQEIRQQLSAGRGGALRRSNLRRHLRDCEGCRAYRADVQNQRSQFAALLPVAPTLLMKEGLVAAVLGAGGAAAVGGSGLIASSALKTGFIKGLSAALIAGAGTLGTVVVSASNLPVRSLTSHARSGSATVRGTAGAHHAHAAGVHRMVGTKTSSASVTVAHAGARPTGHRLRAAATGHARSGAAHRAATSTGHRHASRARHGTGVGVGQQHPKVALPKPPNPVGHVPGSGAPANTTPSPAAFTPPGHTAGRVQRVPPGQAAPAFGRVSPRQSRARVGGGAPGVVRAHAAGARGAARRAGFTPPGHAGGAAGGHALGHAGGAPAAHGWGHAGGAPGGQAHGPAGIGPFGSFGHGRGQGAGSGGHAHAQGHGWSHG